MQAVGAPLIERSHSIEESLEAGTLQVSPTKSQALLDAKVYERPLLSKQLNRISEEKKQCEQ